MGFQIFDAVFHAGASALLALEDAIRELSNKVSEAAENLDIQAEIDAADGGEPLPDASAENSVSIMMLLLQKYVAEWTVILGLTTGLLKSLSDGLEGVARNI